jgi:plasmid stability protein
MSLTLNLPPDKEATLRARALAQGVSAEQYARRVLEEDLQTLESAGKTDNRHISEIIAEIMAGVPPEEFAKLPKDGSREHDHYLYGHPKRNP